MSLCVCSRWLCSIVSCTNSSIHASSWSQAGPRTAEESYMADDVWPARVDHTVLGRPWHQRWVTEAFPINSSQENSLERHNSSKWRQNRHVSWQCRHLLWANSWYNKHLMEKQSSYLLCKYSYRFSTWYMLMRKT